MRAVIIILLFFIFSDCPGQFNYVPNPSFENLDTCPYWVSNTPYGGINYAIPWFQPCIQNSSDYFNICATTSDWSVPYNYFGFQTAKTGNAFAGIVLRTVSTTNYREYIEVELIDTLQNNHLYCLSFFVNLSNNCMIATDAIHANLSNTIVTQNLLLSVLYLSKTIANIPNNFIVDSLDWVEIKGVFSASGGEKYLTIGNFDNDTIAQTLNVNYGSGNYTYYYIDDVSLINCDSLTGIEETGFETIKVYPNPAQEILNVEVLLGNNQLEIFSIDGKRIRILNHSSQGKEEILVDISAFARGAYIIRILNDEKLRTARFVKM